MTPLNAWLKEAINSIDYRTNNTIETTARATAVFRFRFCGSIRRDNRGRGMQTVDCKLDSHCIDRYTVAISRYYFGIFNILFDARCHARNRCYMQYIVNNDKLIILLSLNGLCRREIQVNSTIYVYLYYNNKN